MDSEGMQSDGRKDGLDPPHLAPTRHVPPSASLQVGLIGLTWASQLIVFSFFSFRSTIVK
jgi:hypothetical protein